MAAGDALRAAIKARIKDTKVEPYVRWVVKRSRGIRMPFDLVKNEIYDRQASELMSRVLSTDSNCVDVGCHQGQFLREFLKYAPRGRHFAFEPLPQLAQRLKEGFPSVSVLELALSDTAGEAAFYVVPGAPAQSGLHRREFIRPAEARQELKVRTERLDSVIPLDARIDFIKIDVEGAEGLVLAGAIQTIARNRPYIVLEHGRRSSLDFGVSSEQVYDVLVERCGLRVSLVAGWLAGARPLTRSEFTAQREWYFVAHPPR